MQVIELGAVYGEVDTVRAEFNSGDLNEVRSEDECEKTSAAGDVYEGGVVVAPVPKSDSRTRDDGVGDVQGERDQHNVVILEARVGGNR